MISGSNKQPEKEMEYTLQEPDCHSSEFQKCNLDVRKNDIK